MGTIPSHAPTDAPCQLPQDDITWHEWHVPLACDHFTLQQVLDSNQHIAAEQDEVPLIVKLIENPDFEIPWVTIFNGAVNLHDHDCIHAVLGRGLLPKDEAFVIGFTMGSTNRTTALEQQLFALASKHLYPGPYKFSESDIQVFNDAVRLGMISACNPLNSVNFKELMSLPLREVRERVGVEVDLLRAYFQIEKRRYPDSMESQRLV
jgi:hypothetical protein